MAKIPSLGEWKQQTELGLTKPRSKLFKAIDDRIEEYNKNPTPQNATQIRIALTRWMQNEGGNWEADPRNKPPGRPISTLMGTLESMRLPLDTKDVALLRAIAAEQPARMRNMFAGHKMKLRLALTVQQMGQAVTELRNEIKARGGSSPAQPVKQFGSQMGGRAMDRKTDAYNAYSVLHDVQTAKRDTGKAVGAAVSTAVAPAKKMADAEMMSILNEFFGTQIQEVSQFAATIARETGLQAAEQIADHVLSMLPLFSLVKDGGEAIYFWASVVNKSYQRYKVYAARDVVALGDARRALEAVEHLLNRDIAFTATKAAICTASTGAHAAALAAKGADVVLSPAIGAAKAAANAARMIAAFAIEAREAMTSRSFFANPGEYRFDIFKKCPLIGAYMIDGSSDSDILAMIWDEIGQPGWMDDIERMIPRLEPIRKQAGRLIRESPFVIDPPMPSRYAVSTFAGKKWLAKKTWWANMPWNQL